jgi:hypothetical protein
MRPKPGISLAWIDEANALLVKLTTDVKAAMITHATIATKRLPLMNPLQSRSIFNILTPRVGSFRNGI